MPEEEKSVTELSPRVNWTEWLPCVVSDGTWRINKFINKGDHIYRIFNEKFDVKANMTIKSIGYGMISVHLIDADVDIDNIEIGESLRVCDTSSENDPGRLVHYQRLEFNKELKPGCLYRVIDSELNFQYMMYIRCFIDGHVDADIMRPMIIPEGEIRDGVKYSVIEVKHEPLSIIDLKDMMFTQIHLGEGCNFKLE